MVVVHSYTQFYDIETKTDGFSTFTVTAGGEDVKRRLAPFFGAYKEYKLGKVRVKCVPAATLPVDPTGLSTAVGDQTVDPRDMFNPGLCRITNGEFAQGLTGALATPGDMNQYYTMMLDPRWYKFRLQEGFTREAVPLVYNIVEPAQDVYPGQNITLQAGKDDPSRLFQLSQPRPDSDAEYNVVADTMAGFDTIRKRILMQNERIPLGWMPTDSINITPSSDSAVGFTQGSAPVPEVDLITFIFPKAFKTKFYYRLFVETTVMFRSPVVIDPIPGATVYMPTDRYVYTPLINGPFIPGTSPTSDIRPFNTQGGVE